MSGLLSYSGIVTKVKAMKAQLVTKEEYEKMLAYDGVSEFITYLKQKSNYSGIFKSIDESHIHRGEIEHILIHALYNDYEKIYKFANKKQRELLYLFYLPYELSMLKECMLSIYHQDEERREFLNMDFFKRYSKLPIPKLVGAEGLEEFVQHLKGTKYYDVIKMVNNQQDPTLFDYETQLDIYYYKNVWKMKDKLLKGKELKLFTSMIGQQIDILNILWVYRFKLYYKADIAKIYASIIPIHFKLTKNQLSDMVETLNMEEFFGVIDKSYYKDIININEARNLERLNKKTIRDICRNNTKEHPNSITPIYEYLILKEQEIDSLTTVLECVRYQLKPEESLAILRD